MHIGEKAMRIFRITAFAILTVLAIFLIIHGIALEDISEVISNGAILCLSCVGIG